ncbi:hypothetical protein [Arthrobacter sp. zg-Y1171]|uniref:hypothetical protein n=1 Tax=Arthrobacter sp. zg-Y1171 TaxID=2964610 RepID=UPI0021052A4B|nr:hypothetical protein [Arthrobacter sp. zg-Y1171]MCQ1994259.1 hypothetical protein [Arthrobacter sp. zg-Y1171]UWX81643.1 hypothetical protein N2L00_14840 [Arthrobacter sp. zg-Y1171]
MNDVPLWVTVALPLIGYAAALASELLRNGLQSRRDDAIRIRDRRENMQDRRDQFELEVLRNAYSSLNRLARAAMRFHLVDMSVAKEVGSYASRRIEDLTGAELDEEFRQAAVQLSSEIELVFDDNLRQRLKETRDALRTPSVMFHSNAVDADRAMNKAVTATSETQEALGVRIRELYLQAAPPQG